MQRDARTHTITLLYITTIIHQIERIPQVLLVAAGVLQSEVRVSPLQVCWELAPVGEIFKNPPLHL
jgi:hypothetical protein